MLHDNELVNQKVIIHCDYQFHASFFFYSKKKKLRKKKNERNIYIYIYINKSGF